MFKIKITHVPLKYFYYYQWLILGFYQLAKKNKLEVEIEPGNFSKKFLLRNYFLYLGLRKYFRMFRKDPVNDYCLKAELITEKGKVYFCYDIADTPYYFSKDHLQNTDLYFKAQCPKKIDKEGFALTPDIKIPFGKHALKYKNKIKPSMLGPSCRSNNLFSFKKLNKGYQEILQQGTGKNNMLMCYFGNSKGPVPNYSENPDIYNSESDILGYFEGKISHPNEKRAIVTDMIAELGNGYDARLINNGHFGKNGKPTNAHLFIPLKDYTPHIAQFSYNMNVSGNRLSIPNRFIYSFAVGTAIVTDKLHVKWYKPFGKELIETTEMGYLKPDEVDWESFHETINNLPIVKQDEVLKEFNEKWTPMKFATYVVDECLKCIRSKETEGLRD